MTLLPICFRCKHYIDNYKCRAFSCGIPDDILTMKFEHTEEHPEQDNKIVFQEE